MELSIYITTIIDVENELFIKQVMITTIGESVLFFF